MQVHEVEDPLLEAEKDTDLHYMEEVGHSEVAHITANMLNKNWNPG